VFERFDGEHQPDARDGGLGGGDGLLERLAFFGRARRRQDDKAERHGGGVGVDDLNVQVGQQGAGLLGGRESAGELGRM
jgi:hypothetical protein